MVVLVILVMSSNVFEKILKIIQVTVTLLEMAVKAFTGLGDDDDDVKPEKDV